MNYSRWKPLSFASNTESNTKSNLFLYESHIITRMSNTDYPKMFINYSVFRERNAVIYEAT